MVLFKKSLRAYEKKLLHEISKVPTPPWLDLTSLSSVSHLRGRDCHDVILDFDGCTTDRIVEADGEPGIGYAIFHGEGAARFVTDLSVAAGKLVLMGIAQPLVLPDVFEKALCTEFVPHDFWRRSRTDRGLVLAFGEEWQVEVYEGLDTISFFSKRFAVEIDSTFAQLLHIGTVLRHADFKLSFLDVSHWYWNPWSKSRARYLSVIGRSTDNDVLLVVEDVKGAPTFMVVDQETHEIHGESLVFEVALKLFVKICRDPERQGTFKD